MSEKEKSNQLALARLKNAMLVGDKSEEYIKYIFKNFDDFDLNCRISSTPYLESKKSDLIGFSALHVAYLMNNIIGFKVLLDNGADYQIKDNKGSTVLHKIMEDFLNEGLTNTNIISYVDLILSAHMKANNFSNPCNAHGISHFHAACLFANIEAVEFFLKNNVSIDQCVSKDSSYFPGYSALHFAAGMCNYQIFQILLKHGGIDINSKDAADRTPLLILFELKVNYNLDSFLFAEVDAMMEMLMQDKNTDFGYFSYFHLACTRRHSCLVKCLLQDDQSIDVNQALSRDSHRYKGWAGLHFAAACNNVDIVLLLLSKGANIEIESILGTTAFDVCIERYQIRDIHKIMSSVEPWNNIILSDDKTKLLDLVFAMQSSEKLNEFLINSDVDRRAFVPKNSTLWPGFTILHIAIELCSSDLEIIQVCLLGNCNVVAQDVHGNTPLILAYDQGEMDLVESLIDVYQFNGITSNFMDDDNLSHLHIAVEVENINLVKKILTHNIGVSLAYSGEHMSSSLRSGFTPLHVAIAVGNDCIAKMLMQKGADPYASDFDGLTPIHWILSRNDPRPFDDIRLSAFNHYIIECIADGLSHLHIASYVGDQLSVERLLKTGVDVNTAINYKHYKSPPFLARYAGCTPLHLALMMNNTKIVFDLVKAGADIFAKNPYDSSTPFFDALDGKYEDQLVHFMGVFRKNKKIIRHLEQTIGFTLLHLACRERDVTAVTQQLALKAKVNAKIHDDSPIWPGCTPLHVLMMKCAKPEWQDTLAVRQIVDLFLEYGLDVNIANSEGNTVIHLAHSSLTNLLLSNIRNYRLNPVNNQGLSHFEIACLSNNVAVIRKFIRNGVDVNRQVDFFSNLKAGYSPLHLIVSNENVKRCTVDVLFGNGARIDIRDVAGRTVLHLAASFSYVSLNLMKRIINSGVDINATDVYGKTALETLLSTRNFSIDKVKLFMQHNCSINAFNSITENGYLPMILDSNNNNQLMIIMFEAVLNYLHNDELGRTVVHNIVSTFVSRSTSDEYDKIIRDLAKLVDCSVNCQDKKGRTALHLAAKFANKEAIDALLNNGCDIDINDFDGLSALSYSLNNVFQYCLDSPDRENHVNVIKVLVNHVRLLNFLNLHVSPTNKYCPEKLRDIIHQSDLENIDIHRNELQVSKTIKIGLHSWTVYGFLSETGLVAEYPYMTFAEQKIVDQFIRSCDYKLFPKLEGIIKLQYHKAVHRNALIEMAIEPLVSLTGISFLRLSCENIFQYLSNAELTNLITSVSLDMP